MTSPEPRRSGGRPAAPPPRRSRRQRAAPRATARFKQRRRTIALEQATRSSNGSGRPASHEQQPPFGRVAHPTAQHRMASARPTHERRANDWPASCDQWRAIIGASPRYSRDKPAAIDSLRAAGARPAHGQRASSERKRARGEGPPHAAAAGGQLMKIFDFPTDLKPEIQC
ncbi:hypothetical protein F511_45020 [Dorcoceras hygrometricum]|uniref:Uncharacterized protein n=1 Tax=Dorcoceras hygrometricum TaxID=472368 RepID=A0A2Z7AY24_9LAMI|nr:hypothetical protein F511_45020 [Dorcoceras hygrometricum]